MTVYVDTMQRGYGRMVMSHMVADSDSELLAMADQIGVQRKWHQFPGTARSHFDICQTKRFLAVRAGAVIVTSRQLARILLAKREAFAREAA